MAQSRSTSPLRAALLALALGGAALGCGGKDKGATTTPGAGSGAAADGAAGPPGGGAVTPELPTGEPPGEPGPPATGAPTADAGPPATGEPTADAEPEPPPKEPKPKFSPPNLDPNADEARQGVARHVQTAREALARAPADADAAIRESKAALAIDGTSADATVLLALAYYHKGLYDTAETIIDLAADTRESMKSVAAVYYIKGLLYDQYKRPDSAFTFYQKAVELDPEYGSALLNLGAHQLRNKLFEKAVATYEKVSRKPEFDRPATWSALGAAYRGRSGDFPDPTAEPRAELLRKAKAAFERAIERDRSYGPAYYNLGLMFLDADPFPGDGGPMDNLERLQKAKAYFEEYKNLPGVDIRLYDERIKNVTKLIKREEKKRKKKEKEKKAAEPAPEPAPEGGS